MSLAAPRLLCKHLSKCILTSGDIRFVAFRINERIGSAGFQPIELVFHSVVVAMRSEEDIARERLHDAEGSFVVACDLWVKSITEEFVAGVHVGAAYDNHVIGLSAALHFHSPRGAAFGVTRREMCLYHHIPQLHFISVM